MPNLYLERYGWPESFISTPPPKDLELVVVIPAYDESGLLKTLGSLESCIPTDFSVEVIVMINQSINDSDEVKSKNIALENQVKTWISEKGNKTIDYHIFNITLNSKHAGVGSARKAAMDEAVRRFEQLNKPQGVIVNLDADCLVDENYLTEIGSHFDQNKQTTGASIYFEHPLAGDLDKEIYQGIINYELFLRYYRQGLKYSGFPYHYHTVGSCMAVRSIIYQKQGGMNRRKAGEDFYFLHKIMPLGNFTEITNTCVYPSPRDSHRVPFGTGKAINDWLRLENKTYTTYHPSVFIELKQIFDFVAAIYEQKKIHTSKLGPAMRNFLEENQFNLDRIFQDSGSWQTFHQKFFEWFNGFRTLKFVHHYKNYFKEDIELEIACQELLTMLGIDSSNASMIDLLNIFRKLDQNQLK